MSLEGLVLSLSILVIVALYVAAPLIGRRLNKAAAEQELIRQRERLTLRYEALLMNLRDLEEDYSTGKIDTERYRADRETYMQRGVAILTELDSIGGSVPMVGDTAVDHDAAVDHDIEAAVAAYRAKLAQSEG